MSWAEENNIDCFDEEMIEAFKEDQEDYWKSGKHSDSNGKEWQIRDMESSHIKNTIIYFLKRWPDIDCQPLTDELKRRKEI
jgi:hypothetical protein